MTYGIDTARHHLQAVMPTDLDTSIISYPKEKVKRAARFEQRCYKLMLKQRELRFTHELTAETS